MKIYFLLWANNVQFLFNVREDVARYVLRNVHTLCHAVATARDEASKRLSTFFFAGRTILLCVENNATYAFAFSENTYPFRIGVYPTVYKVWRVKTLLGFVLIKCDTCY